MGSAFFVIQCFILSCLIIAGLQFKISDETLEDQLYSYIKSGEVSDWIDQLKIGVRRIAHRALKETNVDIEPENTIQENVEEVIDAASEVDAEDMLISGEEAYELEEGYAEQQANALRALSEAQL